MSVGDGQIEFISIPSRGFWFFEAGLGASDLNRTILGFQSPRGDFGFLKFRLRMVAAAMVEGSTVFQSPRGDFGFLKAHATSSTGTHTLLDFNPLAGILVF